MKKSFILTISILLVLAITLTACSTKINNEGKGDDAGQNQATTNGAGSEAKDVTIKFWIYPVLTGMTGEADGKPDDWANDRGRRFKEINSNVNVEVELLNWAGGTEKLDVAVASGGAPDLAYSINNFGGVTKYGRIGALEPVDPYMTEEDWKDYPAAVVSAMRYGDKHYLFPLLTLVSAIAVNIDVFEERDALDLLPLDNELRTWTFDEFLAAAKAVTFSRSGAAKPDVFGYAAFGKDGVFYDYLFSPLNGGSILDEDFKEVVFDSQKSIDGLQFLYDLVNVHKVCPEGSAGLTYNNIYEMFKQGQLAMCPSMANAHNDAAKAEKPFKVEYVAFPQGEGAEVTSWNNVGGFMFFKQTDAYKKDMVAEFGKLATNAENSQIVKYIGSFPARFSAGNVYGDEDQYMNYFYKLSAYGNSAFSRSFGIAPLEDMETNIQALLLGAKTPEKVTKDIGEIIKEILNKQ